MGWMDGRESCFSIFSCILPLCLQSPRTFWKMVINSGPGLADSFASPVQYQANGQKQDLAETKDNALPVTLLSGFLVSRSNR